MSWRTLSRWIAVLGSAAASSIAPAVPFTIDLTVPDVHGWTIPAPGMPSTPYTASHVFVRVTGDTDIVVDATGTRVVYQATTLGFDVPGVGRGTAASPGWFVVVADGTLSLSSAMASIGLGGSGFHVSDPALQGSPPALRAVGPVSVASADTFSFGPTSATVPLVTDAGQKLGVSNAGGAPGGTLTVSVGGNAPNPLGYRHYLDLPAFVLATGPNRVATFEEGNPSASGGVRFADGTLQIAQTVPVLQSDPLRTVDEPHAYWFGALGSPTRFALNAATPPATRGITDLEAEFPEDVLAAGFLFNCYDCNLTPLDYGMSWTTRDADGNVLEEGVRVVHLARTGSSAQPDPGFFGLTATRPFRRLTLHKVSPFTQAQPWMIDDLRYATALAGTPPRLVEYHHAAFNHYFVTASADEIAKLDNGTFEGWTRTGLQFDAMTMGTGATMSTCRFFSTAFGAKSSHFYTPDAGECAKVKANPDWQFEGHVFGVAAHDGTGGCGPGLVALFRLYNNGAGGAPNHRYTTSIAARNAMVAAGWTPEGAAPLGVIACVPG